MTDPHFLSLLQAEASALHWVDWLATLTAILYVVLAARENPWCWVWGIISCALWAYASFAFYDLWLDALLQVFYVVMGFVGLYRWRAGARSQQPMPITRLTWVHHAYTLLTGSFLALFFGYFFAEYTSAAATYADAFTTVFSVMATFMLIQKQLENWLYWIAVDATYVWLYASRGAYLFALLMIIYTIIAAVAFVRWRREFQVATL